MANGKCKKMQFIENVIPIWYEYILRGHFMILLELCQFSNFKNKQSGKAVQNDSDGKHHTENGKFKYDIQITVILHLILIEGRILYIHKNCWNDSMTLAVQGTVFVWTIWQIYSYLTETNIWMVPYHPLPRRPLDSNTSLRELWRFYFLQTH